MRTHQQIIQAAGGVPTLAKALGVEPNTAKQWKRLDSIPAKHWKAIVTAGYASWDELGTAAARKAGVLQQDAAA